MRVLQARVYIYSTSQDFFQCTDSRTQVLSLTVIQKFLLLRYAMPLKKWPLVCLGYISKSKARFKGPIYITYTFSPCHRQFSQPRPLQPNPSWRHSRAKWRTQVSIDDLCKFPQLMAEITNIYTCMALLVDL